MVMMPEVPAFPGSIKDTDTVKIIMGAQWRTINRGGASIMVGFSFILFDKLSRPIYRK
jgi:phospholipase D1/2